MLRSISNMLHKFTTLALALCSFLSPPMCFAMSALQQLYHHSR